MNQPLSNAERGSCFISIEDVSLVRGSRTVFEKLSLHLSESRIGLIGDNGAGKSSFFRLICGLDRPQSGAVKVHGIDTALDAKGLPQKVGLMFQSPEDQIIFPTVIEELAFSLTAQGQSRAQAHQAAALFLQAHGLEAWANRAISELSQGQRQQICLAAILIAEPNTLLLDEPYSSLDLLSQARFSAQLRKAHQQIIVSTHALDHLRDFERVIWLVRGQVHADGKPGEVCAAYRDYVTGRFLQEQETGDAQPLY